MRAVMVCVSLPRWTFISTVSPAGTTPRRARSSAGPRTGWPFRAVTTSPLRSPAVAAGDRLHGDAESPALHFAIADELRDDRLREHRGHREADADVAARRPDD